MLRRTSLHAAGYEENPEKYLWEDLGAEIFENGVVKSFRHSTKSKHEYAVAGTLHMDHLASLKDDPELGRFALRHAIPVARALGFSVQETQAKIIGMIEVHATEWTNFLNDLPETSFVREWAEAA